VNGLGDGLYAMAARHPLDLKTKHRTLLCRSSPSRASHHGKVKPAGKHADRP
jgi:hypothetical protein